MMTTTGASAASLDAPGVIALLDLPPGTSATVDGSTHTIRRDDFVGISSVPPTGFHFVAVSSAGDISSSSQIGSSSDGRSVNNTDSIPRPSALHTTGFVLLMDPEEESPYITKEENGSWIVARRYDAHTEEISSTPINNVTSTNLLKTASNGGIDPRRIVPYERFITGQQPVEKWNEMTGYISQTLLNRRGIVSGSKIIPGAFEEEDGDDAYTSSVKTRKGIDGSSICYPPIPCIQGSSASFPMHISRASHAGTKRYLSNLSPSDRTALFMDAEPGSKILDIVLKENYEGRWEELVGDIQLSFLLFLHLGCLSSFEHWRDCISMLSFASFTAVLAHMELYACVIRTITKQLSWIEQDFFEEVEYSGGNFFIPALNRFIMLCGECGDEVLLNTARELGRVAQSRFGVKLAPAGCKEAVKEPSSDDDEKVLVMEVDMIDGSAIDVSAAPSAVSECISDTKIPNYESDEAEDDEDGPMIVSEEDVKASLARSAGVTMRETNLSEEDKIDRQSYPLIFAAMTPQEDILMTCARVLDEATDVSLVREAAAYLEDVESKR